MAFLLRDAEALGIEINDPGSDLDPLCPTLTICIDCNARDPYYSDP